MPDSFLDKLKIKINQQHNGDEQQLKVIFSDSPRIMVEAPAGYGKTTTMISRLAYLYATDSIPNPKKILGLTFSVNSALKIKRDVAEKLPQLLDQENNPILVGERVTATNFHGFCKIVLKKYGRYISPLLKEDINSFKAVDEANKTLNKLPFDVSNTDRCTLNNVLEKIKKSEVPSEENISDYLSIIINTFLPKGYITHNAVILFTLDLFKKKPAIASFYNRYYPLIVVDEFQDTNCISWELLKAIISPSTQLLFLGDSLQRIYGFIGALPNIMETAVENYGLEAIQLTKNYRFQNNQNMLLLDKNIRENARLEFRTQNLLSGKFPLMYGENKLEEADLVTNKIQQILSNNKGKIAVLFRTKNGVNIFEESLKNHGISYFYGMFSDEDEQYVKFNDLCYQKFQSKFSKSKNINKRQLINFVQSIKSSDSISDEKTLQSLYALLDALVEKVNTDYSDLSTEDKYELILDIFENRQLKQAMEYVDSRVLLATIHGAKGLEWDFVIIADLDKCGFPAYQICKECANYRNYSTSRCVLTENMESSFVQNMLDELSVFYVAFTRAREQVYFSASLKNANGYDSPLSCFTTLNGLEIYRDDEI